MFGEGGILAFKTYLDIYCVFWIKSDNYLDLYIRNLFKISLDQGFCNTITF